LKRILHGKNERQRRLQSLQKDKDLKPLKQKESPSKREKKPKKQPSKRKRKDWKRSKLKE
jgi:hypothetical protein